MKTIYSHGTEFHSCAICDMELTLEEPGQRVTYDQDGKRIIEHICNECFAEDSYQELIREKSFRHGIFIRLFPELKD